MDVLQFAVDFFPQRHRWIKKFILYCIIDALYLHDFLI